MRKTSFPLWIVLALSCLAIISSSALAACTAGYTSNYQSSGDYLQQQYQFDDCSTTWIDQEYCPNGCSGYTDQTYQPTQSYDQTYQPVQSTSYTDQTYQPSQTASQSYCTAGYTSNYQCSGNYRQQQYQYDDCSTSWIDQEYCSYGCSNGACSGYNYQTYQPSQTYCTAGYTGYYQCSGNYRQQQYQNYDCSYTWNNQEYCSYGCSGGYCLSYGSYSSYTPGYTGNYQCYGNYRQQQYINSDYSTTWVNAEYCPYGCSGGYCLSYSQSPYYQSPGYSTYASIYASVSTPGAVYNGGLAYTTISFSNSGSGGTYVNYNAYVCRSDGGGCVSMSCNPSSSVYISGYGAASASCYASSNDYYPYHYIRLDYSWNGYAQTATSGTFDMYGNSFGGSGYQCAAQYLNNYQCNGNYRQQQYQNYDCSYTWNNQEYCSSGCSNGYCNSGYACTAQYLSNYQCSGTARQRQYQNSDCSITWNTIETCSNGCSNGACQTSANCVAQYNGNYQCSGNVRQRQYQRSDCTLEWQNIETCSNGCSSTGCSSSSYCSSQQLNNYRCDGNYRQQQYQNSDCSTTWSNYEYCSNGCSNGYCNSGGYTYYYGSSSSCSSQYLNNYQCSGSMKQRQYQNSDCSYVWYDMETCLYGCSNGFCMNPQFQTAISMPSGCDLSISMNNDATLQKGMSVVVSGYIKDQNGNFLRIPFKFYADDEFIVDGKSNEFGYWQAGFTPTSAGKKELKITIPSCNVKKTGEITVVETVSALKKSEVSVYPASIDTQPGKDSLLVIESNLKGIQVKIDGVPAGWLNPSELTIEDDKSYVHVNPVDGATGIYELNITGYSDGQVAFNKKVSFFVSRKTFFGAQVDFQDLGAVIVSRILDLSGLIALVIIAYLALVFYNRGYRISFILPKTRDKQTYLSDVKRKIEQDVIFE